MPVVQALMRYFYYNDLNIDSRPLSVARLIFIMQLVLIGGAYRVITMTRLAVELMRDTYKPLETAELHVTALRQISDNSNDNTVEGRVNTMLRDTLQRRIAMNLHAFMAHKSFTVLLQERPDIMFPTLVSVAGAAGA